MCASATAALLLGALAVLPSRGTEADATLTILKETREAGSQPTINQLYQMLYRGPDSHNQTKLLANTNFSNLDIIPTLKPYNQLEHSPPSDKQVKCCFNDSLPSQFTANKHTEGVHEVNITKDHKKFRKRRVLNVTRTEEFLNNGYYAEVTAVPMINTPPVMERRRKIGEVGSNAPLLNYIFDTYSNTHQHRNEKPGNGNSIYAAAAPEMEALVGSTAHLDCKVDALHDKLVSWVRRKNDEEPMELLTTGTQLYTADKRYSARFIPPDIWRLEVREVRPTDAAHYDCQLSAHPPRTARVTLLVPEVSVRIVDGAGASVTEQVCELGSTVALRCEVRGLRMEGGPSLLWYRREYLLNDDTTRGGISVRTEFGTNGANSVLRVARVRADDAGRYSCSVARAPPPAPPPATVMLHIIKEVSVRIVDGAGASVTEQVCELGSTVALRCEVRGLRMEGGPSLLWYRREYLLNDDTTRGGISVRTEFGTNGANSVLRVARVRADDAGRYSCSVARAPPPAPPPATVMLHIIKGESLAELHQGRGTSLIPGIVIFTLALCAILYN